MLRLVCQLMWTVGCFANSEKSESNHRAVAQSRSKILIGFRDNPLGALGYHKGGAKAWNFRLNFKIMKLNAHKALHSSRILLNLNENLHEHFAKD